MQSSGSGEVEARLTLDAEATRAVEAGGATLESRVVLTDLAAAGWQGGAWERRPDGSASVAVVKGFAQPDEVGAIYAELSGENGPFRSVRATMRDGLVTNDWRFTGNLDLRAPNAGVTADAQLAQSITGSGLDPAKVQELLSAAVGSSVVVTNRVELPASAPREWTAEVGKTISMKATSSQFDPTRGLLVIGGGIVVLLGVVLFLAGEARARRVRRRRR
jgi:hypothetical protein